MALKKLECSYVYAYSSEFDSILGDKKWSILKCLIAEMEYKGFYYILSHGEWRRLDPNFYDEINSFVGRKIKQEEFPEELKNINILVEGDEIIENREDAFNSRYCKINQNAVLFDKAKLRIGSARRDKEFCDILEYREDFPVAIIQVKKYETGSSLNYLFSQARFYCESFLSDQNFLADIRSHIGKSEKAVKEKLLEHIKEDIRDVNGKDYCVKLWLLFDSRKDTPSLDKLPIMAKYDLKITYEKLINSRKFHSITLCMVPVEMPSITIIRQRR